MHSRLAYNPRGVKSLNTFAEQGQVWLVQSLKIARIENTPLTTYATVSCACTALDCIGI